jgi:hypothetical protein
LAYLVSNSAEVLDREVVRVGKFEPSINIAGAGEGQATRGQLLILCPVPISNNKLSI